MSIEITSQFNNKAGKPLDVNSIKSTIVERDAITDRYIGLKVFVEETLTPYILEAGITNNDWVIYKTDWNAKSGSITELVNKPTAQQMFNYVSNVPVVGTYCHAGLIVYKAVAGDKAYSPIYETALVALTVELPDSIFSNVTTSVAVTGIYADVRGLGVGRNNTGKIIGQVGFNDVNSGAYRARVYYPSPYTGFTEPGYADQDWSIPSIEELEKVLIYKGILGMSGNYMTSNDFEASRFWAINTTGLLNAVTKTTLTKVKPVCWIRYSPRISGTNTGDETQSTIIAKSDPYNNLGHNIDHTGSLGSKIPTIVVNPYNNNREFYNLNLNGVRGSIDLRVFSHDIVWDGDWISVSIGNNPDFLQSTILNKIDIIIETGVGIINSSGLAKLVPGTGDRLLKIICLDGRLNLETDFSRVIFRFYSSYYNTQFGTGKFVTRVYGSTLIGVSPNIIINGTSSAPSHSTYMSDTFVWYYNKYGTFSGSSYITNLDSSLPTEPIAGEAVPGRLPSNQYASYPRSKSSDIILNAFQNSLITTDMASMPDIYNIVCHGRDPIPLTAVTLTAGTTGDNYYGWVNYTATTPADGCVVRFTSLTNNPTLNNVDLKVIYGTSTKFGLALLDGTRVRIISNDSGTMTKGVGGEYDFYKYYEPDNINTSSFFAVNSIAVGAGKLSDSDANWQSSYGQGVEFIESTVSDDMSGCPVSWWNLQQQSPAVAIVAAKMKYIKDTTNVSWSTVRMACRETALQSTYNITNNIKWDKYRGFGVIRVTEAITWINLRKSSSRNTIKNSLSLGTLPTYINSSNSIPDMHPLPKKLAQEKITFDNTIEQQSLVDTDKIITQNVNGGFEWISHLNLKNQFTSSIIQTTYENLKTLKDNGQLKIGQYYQFDYTTKHRIVNTNVINEGILERLIIFTTSSSTFHKNVYSLTYPTDEITYDFDNNLCEDNITPRRGWITRRKDTIYNNEIVGFDFRNCKFRRYQVEWDSIIDEWNLLTSYDKDDVIKYTDDYIYVCLNDATEAGTLPTDNTKFIKLFAVTDYVCLTTNSDLTVYIGNTALSFKGNGFLFQDNYLFDYTNVSNINNFVKCTVANNNTILGNFYNNTISGYFYKNTILVEFSYNTISGYFYKNTISGGKFSNNTISVDFSNNTISGGEFSYNTISRYFSKNTILGIFYNNTISVEFSNNTISGNFRYNQILTNVQNVDFSLATHVYSNYNKTIGLNSSGVLYISYIDGDNVQQIVNITD